MKKGGYLVFTVPDEDLYEQGVWPSQWNADHKWTFTIFKHSSWSPKSINVFNLLNRLRNFEVIRINRVDNGYNHSLQGSGTDQTFAGKVEAAIEVVIHKLADEEKTTSIFKHSGARGDIIYGLPVIKEMGGGVLALNLKGNTYVGKPIEAGKDFNEFRQFLMTQDYIKDVIAWDPDEHQPMIDLDRFREMISHCELLSECHLKRFGIEFNLSQPWLTIGEPKHVADIIINRSTRYYGFLNWNLLRERRKQCLFVGFPNEYREFVARGVGLNIGFYQTDDYLDLAKVIAGSKLFIGNQSFAFSLAEAMKHPRVLEVCDYCSNCNPQSDNGYVWLDERILNYFVDKIGSQPANPEQYRKPHDRSRVASRCVNAKPIRNPAWHQPSARPTISIVTTAWDEKCELPNDVKAEIIVNPDLSKGLDKAAGYLLCIIYDASLIERLPPVAWLDEMTKPFYNPKVGVVKSAGSANGVVVVNRKAFERIGFLPSANEMLQTIYRAGYSAVICDGVCI